MIEIKYKKLNENFVIPFQAHANDGGFDVTCTEIEYESEDFVICKLGFACELPKGYKLTLVPRSSFTKSKWILQNSPGLGDPSYTGEYQYRFRAIPSSIIKNGTWFTRLIEKFRGNKTEKYIIEYPEFPYKIGDRIGQVYLEEIIPTKWNEVNELSDSERGSGGFGSTN